jgi:hypothetical protein
MNAWQKAEFQALFAYARNVAKNIIRGKKQSQVDFVPLNVQLDGDGSEPDQMRSANIAEWFFAPLTTRLRPTAHANVIAMRDNTGAWTLTAMFAFTRPTIPKHTNLVNTLNTVLSWKSISDAILNLTKRFITSTAIKETIALKTYKFGLENMARVKSKSALIAARPTLFRLSYKTIASGG